MDLINVVLVPVVVALIGAATAAGFPKRFAGLLSVIVGIATVYLAEGMVFNALTILVGIGTGLAASGLYSGVKAMKG